MKDEHSRHVDFHLICHSKEIAVDKYSCIFEMQAERTKYERMDSQKNIIETLS